MSSSRSSCGPKGRRATRRGKKSWPTPKCSPAAADAIRRQAHVLGRVQADRRGTRAGARLIPTSDRIIEGGQDDRSPNPGRGGNGGEERPNPAGAYIWYELITPDPAGAKAFYDAVVGWTIGDPMAGVEVEYRMIGRGDGGNAGGMLTLDRRHGEHGARPIWLGYLYVADVDASVAAIGGRRQALHAGVGRARRRPDRDGRRPAGRALLHHEADAARRATRTQERRLFADQPGRVHGMNCRPPTPPPRATSTATSSAGRPTTSCRWARWATIVSSTSRDSASAPCAGPCPAASRKWRYYIRVPSIAQAKEAIEAEGGKIAMGPHEVPGGDHIIIGIDPQGAEFALVGGK